MTFFLSVLDLWMKKFHKVWGGDVYHVRWWGGGGAFWPSRDLSHFLEMREKKDMKEVE